MWREQTSGNWPRFYGGSGTDTYIGSHRTANALGTNDYRGADRLREHHHMDLHLFDHRRVSAQLANVDDGRAVERPLAALRDLAAHAHELRVAPRVDAASRPVCAGNRAARRATPTSNGAGPGRRGLTSW